jgi:hypothetical protein
MKKDTYKTDVIFRVDKTGDFKGSITAYFPYDVATSHGEIACYMHVGQHSSADYNYCVGKSRLATEKEYEDLKKELESLGYNLNIIKKQNHSKYLKSYKEVRGWK